MHTSLLIVGALLPMVSAAVYVWAIVRGPVRPQRMTRFLLAAIGALSLASLFASGDRAGLWLAVTSFIESAVIWVLSWWRGIGGRDPLDIACLVLCGVGVAWWIASGDSMAGLIASCVADLIACIPSFVKTVRLPHTESGLFYLLGTLAGLCIALAGPYGWQQLLFPVYILFINAVFMLAIWRPSRLRKRIAPDAAEAPAL